MHPPLIYSPNLIFHYNGKISYTLTTPRFYKKIGSLLGTFFKPYLCQKTENGNNSRKIDKEAESVAKDRVTKYAGNIGIGTFIKTVVYNFVNKN